MLEQKDYIKVCAVDNKFVVEVVSLSVPIGKEAEPKIFESITDLSDYIADYFRMAKLGEEPRLLGSWDDEDIDLL